ncbi:MAG: GxxExxY protein [Verrucomicrobiota bacterium]|nr:GxxExxY protein [Verrucomicrobiota bacterium]
MDADFQKIKRDPQTYAIIGAAMEVHRQLGHGFLEAVYQEALAIELAGREIHFQREASLPIFYKGVRLQCGYRADFICFDEIVVELKAVSELTGVDEAQTINELKAIRLNRALLINFGPPSLQYKRLVFNLRESAKSADEIKNINLMGV